MAVTISADGSRFCVAYKNGKVAVVDRNVFLFENPQRRSRAFNYSVDCETSLSPPSAVFGPSYPHFTSDSDDMSYTPFTINFRRPTGCIADSSSMEYTVSSSIEKARPASRSSRRTSYYADSAVGSQFHQTNSQPHLTERTPLHRTSSQLSMTTSKWPLTRTSSKSSIASESNDVSDSYQRPPSSARSPIANSESIPIHTSSSSVFGSMFSILSDAGQNAVALSHSYSVPQFRDKKLPPEADCCWFGLAGWTSVCQYRKLVWIGSTLYIWFSSAGIGFQTEQNIIIAVKFADKKFFAFR